MSIGNSRDGSDKPTEHQQVAISSRQCGTSICSCIPAREVLDRRTG